MKIVPQLIILVILLAVGWIAYEKHDAFRELVNDIAQYSGIIVDRPHLPVVEDDAPRVQTPVASETVGEPITDAAQPDQSTVKKQDVLSSPVAEPASPLTARDSVSLEEADKEKQSQAPEMREGPAQQHSMTDSDLFRPEPTASGSPDEGDRMTAATDTESSPASTDYALQTGSANTGESRADTKPMVRATETAKVQDGRFEYPRNPDTPRFGAFRADKPDADSPQEVTRPAAEPLLPAEARILQRKQNALAGLIAARQAWHSGQPGQAIWQYQYLMREYGNHPDFAGELGNIYLSRGETRLAVDAYSEAVIRLLKNGDRPRAARTLNIIHNLDQERADILRQYFAPLH